MQPEESDGGQWCYRGGADVDSLSVRYCLRPIRILRCDGSVVYISASNFLKVVILVKKL
jgi:hypothetical protein